MENKKNIKYRKKLIKYQKKVFDFESKFNSIKNCNVIELENFYKSFCQYKITCKLLYTDPTIFSTIKLIELDKSVSIDQYVFNEIIWNHEHYEFIEKMRSIENDLILLIKDSVKFDLVTKIQYKLIKGISPKIYKIFESDSILIGLYMDLDLDLDSDSDSNIYIQYNLKLISKTELDFYFDIIEIILFKMFIESKKKNYLTSNTKNISDLLNNQSYTDNIIKIKNLLTIKKNI